MMVARNIQHFFKYPFEIRSSEKIDIDSVRTVCLALGPYRNLTTLTASMLALHPNCQVLNHAGMRIFKSRKLNFLKKYANDKFDAFTRYAIYLSGGGKRGDFGGSITLSHAFTRSRMQDMYQQRFGDRLVKENIHAVFWKESLRTSNYIRRYQPDLERIFTENSRLRFLLPVRHPLDCAVSNRKTGHYELFQNLGKDPSIAQLTAAILDEFVWFLKLKDQFPERFFFYFENKFTEQILKNLANFLDIKKDQKWIDDCLDVFVIKKSYDHEKELIEFYKKTVEDKFMNYPEFSMQLLKFVD